MANDTLLEKQFLLGNVMQIAVLTHAEAFKDDDVDRYFNLIRKGTDFAETVLKPLFQSGDLKGAQFQKNRVKLPGGYKKAWEKVKKSNWQNPFRSLDPEGNPVPDSAAVALREVLSTANPYICNILAATMLTADLINKYVQDKPFKNQVDTLYACEQTGALAIFEPGDTHHVEMPGTVAVPENDGTFLVKGVKDRVVGGDHDLAENIVYLITARIESENGEKDRFALLAVPRYLERNGKTVDNGVRLKGIHASMGLKAVPSTQVEFGSESESRGFLLELPGTDLTTIHTVLEGWYSHLALQNASRTDIVYQDLYSFADQLEQNKIVPKGVDFHTRIASTRMQLKSIDEGLRGAIYMTAFFKDCAQYGAESRKEYFSDLYRLYNTLLSAYAPIRALDAVETTLRQTGGLVFDSQYSTEQCLRDLQSSILLGPEENKAAEMLLDDVLPMENGRIFQQLLKQFNSVDSHLVVSENLNEAIAVWRDYIGGLIVLFDDLMNGQENSESRISSIFSAQIVALFGDVILCYHLIIQAMEAERLLAEQDVNFFNLRQDILNNPELQQWYSKLLLAEYFAVHVLSLQESTIRLIQRNPQALLERI